jgi:glutathione synthase/RimK-type ligase-like ATP-grasp enzyme
MNRVLILTPDPDWNDEGSEIEHQLELFKSIGLHFDVQPWTDHTHLGGYDLIVPIMAWGYHQLPEQWLALLDRLAGQRVLNPVPVLRWNWDKAYLLDLASRGVPVVPTLSFDALTRADLTAARAHFASDGGGDDLVIKPPVSGGADGTYLLRAGTDAPAGALGLRTLVQPLMPAITREGEYSLIYFGGQFSHAILKTPRSGDFRVQAQFGGTDRTVTPEPAALAVAAAALAATPEPVAYARVDLVRDGPGFALMELELIEPYLWLDRAPDGGQGFVAALTAVTR